ncbi:MAG: hypothetical protein IPN71_03790 [Fibrobacteres bacterium]|nr:hypothetical protein [Fibrobacterota bacterium]
MLEISDSDTREHIVNTILSSIELQGYGAGQNWIGCCRKRENFSIKLMKKIVSFFCSHFSQDFEHCHVASSLIRDCYFPIDNDKKFIIFAKQIERKLPRNGLLQFDLEHDGIEKLSTPECFKTFSGPTIETIRNLSYTLMLNSRVFGHLFIVFETLNAIAYPHNETGFGFIAIDRSIPIVHPKVAEFLSTASMMNDFESIYFRTRPAPDGAGLI